MEGKFRLREREQSHREVKQKRKERAWDTDKGQTDELGSWDPKSSVEGGLDWRGLGKGGEDVRPLRTEL